MVIKGRGFALIVAIFFVIVFSVIGVIAVSMLSTESFSSLRDLYGYKALHAADAGVRYTVAAVLYPSSDWTNTAGFTKNIDGSSFDVSFSQTSMNQVTMKVKGNYSGVSRTVQVTVTRSASSSPKDFGYGLFAGNQGGGPLYVTNSATVNGDFYYNGNVIMTNSAKLINGILTSRSVTLQNYATCASWEPLPVPPVCLF